MNKGLLSYYFIGVAFKRLSSVEVNAQVSNQHEFNGSWPLRLLLGEHRNTYEARFLWLYGENEGISCDGKVTWYDARERKSAKRAAEYRLYFYNNDVMNQATEGDLLIVARRPHDVLCMIVIPAGSTIENQVCWLFDINEAHSTFQYRDIVDHNVQIDYAVAYILEELGVEVEDPQVDYLDTILEPFLQTGFPSTAQFSRVARSTFINACPIEQPDHALIAWMEHEERLFKRLERHSIAKVLESGFSDVEGFLRYSLSVQNRRKVRVGQALENHLEEIFLANQIRYTRGAITENKTKPDFVFPCIDAYRDSTFSDNKLTMLGVKSTCKDRWRQVLTEAKRIHTKHLLTLEPGISLHQTAEMQANCLQLVLPSKLHETYADQQRKWLLTLQGFIMLLRERQSI